MTQYNLIDVDESTDHEVDPVSRIEGHLGIKVRVDADGVIQDANAHGNLWRGFENFLLGRDANDAITFTQRICGVCPVPHGMTSTFAVDTVLGYSRGHITFMTDAQGYGVPKKALHIRNLVLSAEFLMSSITHFYHLVAPSYVQGPAIPPWTPYFADEQYQATLRASNCGSNAVAAGGNGVVPDANTATMRLWDAVIISYVRALKIRRLTFEAGALFAGRMPMTSCYVGGGVTNDGTEDLTARANKFRDIIREVGEFIFREYVPIVLALGALYPAFDNKFNDSQFEVDEESEVPASIQAKGFGGGVGRFLAWGAFPQENNSLATVGGLYDVNTPANSFKVENKQDVIDKFLTGGTKAVPANLTEDISNARYGVSSLDTAAYAEHDGDAAYPGKVARTKPNRAKGYTYSKAPRWNGLPCEVGPFARLVVGEVYPVGGETLSSWSALSAQYAKYLAPTAGIGAAIAPTIAAGLANTNLNGSFAAAGAGQCLPAVENYILNCKGGLSTIDRLRARGLESLVLVQQMVGNIVMNADGSISWSGEGWVGQLKAATGDTWTNKSIPVGEKQGWGATEAPRGALMHQCTINNGKITKYQCIVPTTWNMSPKDADGVNGPIEQACIGTTFMEGDYVTTGGSGGDITATKGGVEVLRVAQSFDPCIACAIH